MRKLRFSVFAMLLCSGLLASSRGVLAWTNCDEQADACNEHCGGSEYWDYVNHRYRWDASSTDYFECDPFVEGGTGAVCICLH